MHPRAATGFVIERLEGLQAYQPTLEAMRAFTDQRGPATRDHLWVLEHRPVFTLGQAGRPEHLLNPGAIPVVRTDRGGQVTYHGPGQLVVYVLLDLRRAGLGVKRLVEHLEQGVILLLASYGIQGERRADAPGVYVAGAKIASLGLRIRNGCSYHGLALNVAMDLEPFGRINPCGYPGLAVTQMRDLVPSVSIAAVASGVIERLVEVLGAPRA
ncbi:octanoyltransferase [Thiocapsa imhoffii]|uniref:Octanoyltransferase n=1 Tax=Thiocapsa imhoffii TaxID=382777 RepID=A0A9X1BA59_9GAMM|nr:lipoyl(octanoyl) transferase LipB [Thiocapsa imhoffii]MBK1646622.1 octanoyltransferase [Thiocapsa imhoffii]